jgi:hypothetical protein
MTLFFQVEHSTGIQLIFANVYRECPSLPFDFYLGSHCRYEGCVKEGRMERKKNKRNGSMPPPFKKGLAGGV